MITGGGGSGARVGMGNCCPCFKGDDDEAGSTEVERAPLLPRGDSKFSGEANREISKESHYQNVVDSAQRNFINSSGLRMFSMANNDSNDLRSQLSRVEMTSDAAQKLVNSPPSKYSKAWESNSQQSSQQVIDTLSRAVSVYKYDNVADEMAEMIAKHTFSMDVDDSDNSTVATFKPVNATAV